MRRSILCCLFAGLTVLLTAEANADSLTIDTDTTWRSIGPVGDQVGQPFAAAGQSWELLNGGWNTSLAYDDSDSAGWHAPVLPFLSNLLIIWPDGDGLSGSSPAYFRKEFEIPGPVTSGELRFGVDDDTVIYVNGVIAFSDINGLATTQSGIDIQSLLVEGTNLVAVKAHNMQFDNGFDATLSIEFVPEPSTLALLVAGLLGLGSIRVAGCLGRGPEELGRLQPTQS